MVVRGVTLDFDVTCPEDLQRYARCGEELARREAAAPPMPQSVETPAGQAAYAAWLTALCGALTDWIDGVFGEGSANALLGKKTSLAGILALCEELRAAAEAQGAEIARHIAGFAPNRSTRRGRADGKAHSGGGVSAGGAAGGAGGAGSGRTEGGIPAGGATPAGGKA